MREAILKIYLSDKDAKTNKFTVYVWHEWHEKLFLRRVADEKLYHCIDITQSGPLGSGPAAVTTKT